MQQSEIMQRVIGILTKGAEWQRLLTEDPGRTDIQGDDTVDKFVGEIMPRELAVPDGEDPQEVADAIMSELRPAIGKLIAAFAMAFLELAQEHDAAQPEKSSSDILRALALRAGQLDDE